MTAGPRTIDVRKDPDAHLDAVVAHLRAGGLIAYPTETVYGLGGGVRPDVVQRVRALKARERGKPLIVLVRSAEAVSDLRWTDGARELARIFWPGPLTLVLEDPLGIFPPGVRDEDTHAVGVRVSPHPFVALIVERLGEPLTSTSLNAAGEPPAESGSAAAEVVRRLGAPEVLVLDGGTLAPSKPSSVVDCTGPEPVVLREGAVPTNRLRCAVPTIQGPTTHG
jgi:L-threonylcarbamoyladenylate synthase